MKKFAFGSVDHQRELARLIGYDFTKWNPDDEEQKRALFHKALSAQMSGKDCTGNPLSPDDLALLSVITGRLK